MMNTDSVILLIKINFVLDTIISLSMKHKLIITDGHFASAKIWQNILTVIPAKRKIPSTTSSISSISITPPVFNEHLSYIWQKVSVINTLEKDKAFLHFPRLPLLALWLLHWVRNNQITSIISCSFSIHKQNIQHS